MEIGCVVTSLVGWLSRACTVADRQFYDIYSPGGDTSAALAEFALSEWSCFIVESYDVLRDVPAQQTGNYFRTFFVHMLLCIRQI